MKLESVERFCREVWRSCSQVCVCVCLDILSLDTSALFYLFFIFYEITKMEVGELYSDIPELFCKWQ